MQREVSNTKQEAGAELDALGDRIRQARGESPEAEAGVRRHAAAHSAASVAWRMFADLLAGILVGFGLGWVVDGVFDTRPLFMVIISLLGMASGIRLALRTARRANIGEGENGDSSG